MKTEIKDELDEYLNNTLEYDFQKLKNDVGQIMLKHYKKKNIFDFRVVCDNTNNNTFTINEKFIIIDIYYKEKASPDTLCYNITMKVDKICMLKKKRKKKLEKLNGI